MDAHCPSSTFYLPSPSTLHPISTHSERTTFHGTSCNFFVVRVQLDRRTSGVTNHLKPNFRTPKLVWKSGPICKKCYVVPDHADPWMNQDLPDLAYIGLFVHLNKFGGLHVRFRPIPHHRTSTPRPVRTSTSISMLSILTAHWQKARALCFAQAR